MTWFRCTGGNGSSGDTKGGLPAIASTGAQWIALPLYDDDNPIIEFKMLQPTNINQSIIIGDLWDLSAFCLYMESDNNNYFRYNTSYENMYTIPRRIWKWASVKIDYALGKVTVDGVEYTTQNPKTQLHNQVYLFGLAGSHMTNVAITDFKVYKNNTLYLNFEPREDASTGAGYFYDTVGQQDYYSDSSTPLSYVEIGDTEELELVYSLQSGGVWETFANPNSTEPLIVEAYTEGAYTSGFPQIIDRKYTVDLSLLPSLDSGGDPYTTIGLTAYNVPINMRTGNNGATVYISANGTLQSSESVRVYKQISKKDIPSTGITLFKDGSFYHQDIMTFNLTNYVIEDECLKLTGAQVNGFAANTSNISKPYTMVVTFNMPIGTPYCQFGRSVLGGNVYDIVTSGTGRISYYNYTSIADDDTCVMVSAQTGEGIFIACGDQVSYIKEITIYPHDAVIKV